MTSKITLEEYNKRIADANKIQENIDKLNNEKSDIENKIKKDEQIKKEKYSIEERDKKAYLAKLSKKELEFYLTEKQKKDMAETKLLKDRQKKISDIDSEIAKLTSEYNKVKPTKDEETTISLKKKLSGKLTTLGDTDLLKGKDDLLPNLKVYGLRAIMYISGFVITWIIIMVTLTVIVGLLSFGILLPWVWGAGIMVLVGAGVVYGVGGIAAAATIGFKNIEFMRTDGLVTVFGRMFTGFVISWTYFLS